MSFEHLGLHEPILRAVRTEGYQQATPIQLQAIPHMLQGRDLIGCAQTGTGKTAAFALPMLQRLGSQTDAAGLPAHGQGSQRQIRGLILSPTRELAVQISESLRVYGKFIGLRHAVVYGGVSQRPQVSAIRNGAAILVATPGRLLDLMGQGHIHLAGVEILVLDEADRMLDMGFLPALKRIVERLPRTRQTVMFSATMPDEIRRLAAAWLREPLHVQTSPASAPAEKVTHSVYYVEPRQKPVLLAHLLTSMAISRSLVFARTKHGADKVVRQLMRDGIRAAAIHGNKSQSSRQKALAQFKSEQPPVLVATDIAARGLDIDAISHVINYDLPDTPETYIHRIGRAGRAGNEGAAISFCGRDERSSLRSIERIMRRSITVEQQHPPYPSETQSPSKAPAAKSEGRGQTSHRSRQGAQRSGYHAAGGQAAQAHDKKSGTSHHGSGTKSSASRRPGKRRRRRTFARTQGLV